MNEFDLEHTLIDMFNNMKNSINARPLNLGGIAGSGGGIGGPPGGYVGYLPQTRVSYDLSEEATLDVPISGASLLDNLNRIRYRIGVVESGMDSGVTGIIDNVESITVSGMGITIINQNPVISGGLVTDFGTESSQTLDLGIKVYESGILKSSEIQELDFINSSITISDKKATISGIGTAGSESFLGLTDTPNSYVGQAGKSIIVASGEDSLVFTTISGIDPTAIHDNVSGEIVAIAEKTTPINTDIVLIEDVEASWQKKYTYLGNIRIFFKNTYDSYYAPITKGVTNGDSHDHSGGDGAQISHTTLSNIGTNNHAALDTFVASKAAASGLASLNASTLVVENPANATATPTASKIPIADASGTLDGWITGAGVTNGNSHDHFGGDGAQIDHGGQAGLSDDDHTQYVLANGTRNISGLIDIADIHTYARNAQTIAYGGDLGPEVKSQGNGAAGMSFHRPGLYAINFGLDTNNKLSVGGWSMGANSYPIFHAGYPQWVYLTTPLTSTSWDGDAYSTTGKTLIDLSAVFGVPAGIKAVLLWVAVRDSASATAETYLILGPTNSNLVGMAADPHPVNDRVQRETIVVPCDANGDIYYQIGASGAGTFDVWIQIWGYCM